MSLAETFSTLRADYDAARQSRFRRSRSSVSGIGRSGDWHYRSDGDYLRIMELSRDFDQNNLVVGQGVNRLVDNVLQEGFTLDPQTGDDDLDKFMKTRWKQWAEDPDRCDLAGELDFHGLEQKALRQTIVDGDVLGVLPQTEEQIEMIEAHRLRSPTRTKRNIVHGVLLDENRRRLEYYFTKNDVDLYQAILLRDLAPRPVRDEDGNRQILHIYNPKRISQTRGVSHLAPISDVLGMHDDLQFAKLVQAQSASIISILHTLDESAEGNIPSGYGPESQETLKDGSTRTLMKVSPGTEYWGLPGEKLEGFAPNVPNPEFFPHAMLVLTFVAVNLDLPVSVLLLDPSNTNFSGWRGAIDQARKGWRKIQTWLRLRFHRPVYRWKVRQWLATVPDLKRLQTASKSDSIDVFAHRWNAPEWEYIEPLKDASADLLITRNALNSQRRVQAKRGRDWEEVSTEIVDDNGNAIVKAKTKAQEINKQFPEDQPVHWREVLSLPVAEGVQVSINAGDDSATQEPAQNPQGARDE